MSSSQSASQYGFPAERYLQLLPLFLGSGCAALIYEITWYQSLTLIVGSNAVSLAVVLATYMGGMCLGSLWSLRWAETKWHPLRLYAALEVVIAAFGLLVLFLLPWLGGLYSAVGGEGFGGALWRGLFCAAFVLIPTMAMGATLPVIARLIDLTPRGVSWVGFLYAANIAGAVSGCLLAGFYLLRVHDTATASYVAAVLNIVVAIAALILARGVPRLLRATDTAATPPASASPAIGTGFPSGATPIYLAIALSGATALGAEVVWTRLLALLLGGTVYTFALILAAMLIGLGIGGFAGAALAHDTRGARRAFCIAQIGVAAGLAWAAWSVTHLLPLLPIDPDLSPNLWVHLQLDLLRCLWVVAPAAACWGASVPLAIAALSPTGTENPSIVAKIYAANTLGAIAGALITSLVLIASLGTQNTQRVLIAGAALSVLLLLASRSADAPRQAMAPLRYAIGVGAMIACLLLGWTVSPTPSVLVGYGRLAATRAGMNDEFIYVGEGMNASLAVSRVEDGVLQYHNAGKVQASGLPWDMRLQIMLGHLTTLIPAAPKNVLVIGCGAGVTAGAVSIDPRVERETIVELEGLVPYVASTYFREQNFDVIANPKVRTRIDDGRHFLLTTDEKFDAITMDPFDPWVKGVATLNTLEFFQEMKRHLNPGGVVTIFIQLYGMDTASVKSEFATFAKVFPNGIFFGNTIEGLGSDGVLIGTADDLRIDIDAMQERLQTPEYARVRDSLSAIGFDSAVDLLGTFAARLDQMTDWLADAEITRDRNLRLQYLAGRAISKREEATIYNDILRQGDWPTGTFTGLPEQVATLRSIISPPEQ